MQKLAEAEERAAEIAVLKGRVRELEEENSALTQVRLRAHSDRAGSVGMELKHLAGGWWGVRGWRRRRRRRAEHWGAWLAARDLNCAAGVLMCGRMRAGEEEVYAQAM